MRSLALALLATCALVLAACDTLPATAAPASAAPATPPLAAQIDCGPVPDVALCYRAVEVAAAAKLNPPPLAAVTLRRPRADDDCVTWFHACGPESIIVVLQSGDTVQDVPLIRTADGWVRLDLVR